MALRIRKSIRIAPGVRMNLGKRGVSYTIGRRGLSVNVSKRGTYLNAGIPGSGISSRTRIDAPAGATAPSNEVQEPKPHLHWRSLLIFFGSAALAGATKSEPVLGFFWLAWFGYWTFLLLRSLFRKRA